MKPVYLLLLFTIFLLPVAAEDPSIDESTAGFLKTLYRDSGGFALTPDSEKATLAATNMTLRAYRYLGFPLKDGEPQKKFLLSRFDASIPAFVEVGEQKPTVVANAMALMIMAELQMPEDVYAISAQRYLIETAETDDEVYMAMAGMAVMGVNREIPGDWISRMIDLSRSEEESITEYQRSRALITLGRCGLQLPDYSNFSKSLETRLEELDQEGLAGNPENLQKAYTIGRALVMMDGRADLDLPSTGELISNEKTDNVGTIYRVAVLRAWEAPLSGEVRVAICTGFAPVGYRDEAGQVVGMDVDVIRAFCEDNGYQLAIRPFPRFDLIWEEPAKGSVDVAMSGLSKRKERLIPGIRWSYPYFNVDRSLTILKKNEDRFRDIADFDGAKIAVTKGTTGEQDVRERNPNAIRVPYDDEESAIADLRAGKVHALARGDVSNRWDAKIYPELKVIDAHPMDPVEEFVIAVATDRVALGQKLDRWLIEQRWNGGLDELFKPYLTAAEKE